MLEVFKNKRRKVAFADAEKVANMLGEAGC